LKALDSKISKVANHSSIKYYVKCSEGHKCDLIRSSYKDSDGKDIIAFTCKICDKKGKCKDGAYVCA